jgi:hypothetical protein
MRTFTLTAIALAAALCAPASLQAAQGPGWSVGVTVTSGDRDLGYRSGLRYGETDGRHHVRFNFAVASDYRYGGPEFRLGFERGYREAYARWAPVPAPVVVAPPYLAPPPPPVVVEPRAVYGRPTFAFDNGYSDGYREGLNDGRHRHRNDPFAESRWRNADHGYDREFGSRDFYRVNYRHGFENGYARGYSEGWYYR